MTLDEKIELIYDSYTRSLDYEIACLRADLTDEEREQVDQNEFLHLRMRLWDAEIQEELITNLRNLAKSDNENIKLKATLDLGKMIYKKRFDSKKGYDDGIERPSKIVLEGVEP